MKSSLWNYFNGYVKISVTGLSLEKFLNLVAQNNLVCYDACRTSQTSLTVFISASCFKKLHKILRETKCKVKILKKHGLPFLLMPYRMRSMLLVGGIVFAGALFVASQFVWQVDIKGNKKIETERIMQAVEQYIKPGTLKTSVNMAALKAAIENENQGIAWVGTQINGSKITINIVEGEPVPEIEETEMPSNIMATKEAMIAEITTLKGFESLKVGEIVKPGDIIISGTLPENQNAPVRYVTVRGKVTGRVWYTAEAQIDKNTNVKERTGNYDDAISIELANQKYIVKNEYEEYEPQELEKLGIYNLFIPLEITRERRYEIADMPATLTTEQMKEKSEEIAWNNVTEMIPKDAKITDKSLNFDVTDTGVRAIYVVETLEDIGENVPMQ